MARPRGRQLERRAAGNRGRRILCRPHPQRLSCGFARRPGLPGDVEPRRHAAARRMRVRQRHGFTVEWLEAGELQRPMGLASHGGCGARPRRDPSLPLHPSAARHGTPPAPGSTTAPGDPGTDLGPGRAPGHRSRTDDPRLPADRRHRLPRRSGDRPTARPAAQHLGGGDRTVLDLSWSAGGAIVSEAGPYGYLRTSDDGRVRSAAPTDPGRPRIRVRASSRPRRRGCRRGSRAVLRGADGGGVRLGGHVRQLADGLPYVGTHPKIR